MRNKSSEHIEAIMSEMMNTEGWKYIAALYEKEIIQRTDDLIDNSSGNGKLKPYTGEEMRAKAMWVKLLKMFINKPQEIIKLYNTSVDSYTVDDAVKESGDMYREAFPE